MILGIDPGTRRVGYGVIQNEPRRTRLVSAGLIPIKSRNDEGALKEIKSGVDALIRKFRPETLAIEKLFFVKNQKTGLQVAQARGVIILAASERGLQIKEYSPNEIKAGLTGYGLADKKAVLKMVRLVLNEPRLEVIDDVSDALAVALMAVGRA